MFAVHATWHDAMLLVWAEDASLPVRTTSRAKVRDHPYAVSPQTLADALGRDDAEQTSLTVVLPGIATSPDPSPELGREQASKRPTLGPWRVPALAFDSGSALELFGDDRRQPGGYRRRGCALPRRCGGFRL